MTNIYLSSNIEYIAISINMFHRNTFFIKTDIFKNTGLLICLIVN